MRLVVLILLATGCIDHTTLAVSTATLACDWLQTRGQADMHWPNGTREGNPVMGHYPSVDRVDLYFASVAVANAVLWSMLPKGWRSVAPIGIIGLQAGIIADNAPKTGLCQ